MARGAGVVVVVAAFSLAAAATLAAVSEAAGGGSSTISRRTVSNQRPAATGWQREGDSEARWPRLYCDLGAAGEATHPRRRHQTASPCQPRWQQHPPACPAHKPRLQQEERRHKPRPLRQSVSLQRCSSHEGAADASLQKPFLKLQKGREESGEKKKAKNATPDEGEGAGVNILAAGGYVPVSAVWCYLQPAALRQADHRHILQNGVLPPTALAPVLVPARRWGEDSILQDVTAVGLLQGRWLKVAPHGSGVQPAFSWVTDWRDAGLAARGGK